MYMYMYKYMYVIVFFIYSTCMYIVHVQRIHTESCMYMYMSIAFTYIKIDEQARWSYKSQNDTGEYHIDIQRLFNFLVDSIIIEVDPKSFNR